jgi:FkbM family methyltransferase
LYFHGTETAYFKRRIMPIKQRIKDILLALNLPVTRNLKYDSYTIRIMKRVLKPGSNCADIGCHKGEILDLILKYSPQGKHFAFEPLPHLYEFLKEKYTGKDISVHQVALFDSKGTTSFQHVVNAPAYSGIRKRQYATGDVEIRELAVPTDLLDNIIPENLCIDFIKIDVEGAEFGVFKGGIKTLKRCKPYIVFEFGMGAADFYGTKPQDIYSLLVEDCGLKISTLHAFLHNRSPLTQQQLEELFRNRKEYYFIAHP